MNWVMPHRAERLPGRLLPWVILVGVAAAFMMPRPGPSAAIDLHRFWDQRCADCHGHAGAFARNFLTVQDGVLQGSHHRNDLRGFLGNHGAPAGDVDAIYAMLLAQAQRQDEFKARCGRCHRTAADVARGLHPDQSGVLVLERTGRPVAAFLAHHGGLTRNQVPFFVELLTRLEGEVHRP